MHLHKIILGTSTVWVQHARSLDETSLSNAVLSVCTFFFYFPDFRSTSCIAYIYIHHFLLSKILIEERAHSRGLSPHTRPSPRHTLSPPRSVLSPSLALSVYLSLCLSPTVGDRNAPLPPPCPALLHACAHGSTPGRPTLLFLLSPLLLQLR